MGWRYRKRIKIFPGITLNVSKSGVSTTIGKRGASVNVGSKGSFLNLSILGSGLYSRTKISSSASSKSRTKKAEDRGNESQSGCGCNSIGCIGYLVIFGILYIITSLAEMATDLFDKINFEVVLACVPAFVFVFLILWYPLKNKSEKHKKNEAIQTRLYQPPVSGLEIPTETHQSQSDSGKIEREQIMRIHWYGAPNCSREGIRDGIQQTKTKSRKIIIDPIMGTRREVQDDSEESDS